MFRAEQREHLFDPHVAPVNRMVDELSSPDHWMPYVAPAHGGVDATVLSVLRDPGPKTQDGHGSGYLCIENDDATAQAQCEAFATVGITARDITPWNAYPWYINRQPTTAERETGVEPLLCIVELMPRLTVVLLQGGDAADTWRRLLRQRPEIVCERNLTVVDTYHPGRQALRSPDPSVREQRQQARLRAYERVATTLGR